MMRSIALLFLLLTTSPVHAGNTANSPTNTATKVESSTTLNGASTTSLQLLDPMGVLVNAGVSQPFAVSTLKACTDLCSGSDSGSGSGSGSISAVSYSKAYNLCLTSSCGYLKTVPSALWQTYTCVQPRNALCNPRPKFEWLMTDACGNANTGWYMPGLLLTPRYAAAVYNASYSTAISPSLGNAITYPGTWSYFSGTDQFEVVLSYQKPLTLYGAFNVSTPLSYTNFPIVEFGYYSGNGYYYGPQLWIYNSRLMFNFNQPSNGNVYCTNSFDITMLVNSFNYVALTYNPSTTTFTAYFNGASVGTYVCSMSSASTPVNMIVSAGRPNGGGFASGTVYCLKIFEAVLTLAQVQDLATECVSARFSI